MSNIEVRVDGQFLDKPWGELAFASIADGGCLDASWKMQLPPTFSDRRLMRGKLVEIRQGPKNLWAGTLVSPDVDDEWTFHAQGLFRLAGWSSQPGYICFDGSLNTTSTPDVAIDQAIARGLPWKRPASLSNTAFAATGSTDSLNYLGDLLDAWALSVSKRWGVSPDGEVYAVADPAAPTWHLTTDSGRFGLADDEYASHIYVRYMSSGAVYATTSVADTAAESRFGHREYAADATPRGVLTGGQAAALGTGLLAKGKARLGYTNGVQVTAYQLTTPGGTPAPLSAVRAQQKVRMFGVLDEQGNRLPYVDWVIGQTGYEAGAQVVDLTPVGLVARSFEAIVSEFGGAA